MITNTARIETLEKTASEFRRELDEQRAVLNLLARAQGFDPDALRFPEVTP